MKGVVQAGWPEVPGYELHSVIGRGGYATVYRGTQTSVNALRAVKVLAGSSLAGEEERHFRQEVEAIAALAGHPHVVALIDAGATSTGAPYLSMQLVPGGSFGEELRARGALDATEVVRIGAEVADALGAAHELGIVHRDIKPDNVLIGRRRRALLTDFGIATLGDATRTASGTITGTLGYLAPELIHGARPSPASDVWALGMTLYTLLAGASAFAHDGEHPGSILWRISTEDVPPLPSSVPADVRSLIDACLVKEAPDRAPLPFVAEWLDAHRGTFAEDRQAGDLRTVPPVVRTGDTTIALPPDRATPPRQPVATSSSRTDPVPRTATDPSPPPTPPPTAPKVESTRHRRPWAWVVAAVVSVVAVGGAALLLSPDDPDDGRATSTAEAPGPTVEWTYTTAKPIGSTPAVVDGQVVVGTHEGAVVALDRASGSERWQAPTGALVFSSPRVLDDTVYVGGNDGFLRALALGDGATVWESDLGSPVEGSPAVTPDAVVVGSDRTTDGVLRAVDPTDGETLWEVRHPGAVHASPTIGDGDGTIFVGWDGGGDDLARSSFRAVDGTSGETKWEIEGRRVRSSAWLEDGLVYFGTVDGALVAADADTGAIVWEFPTGGEISSSPTVVDGVAYVGSYDGSVYAVRVDTGGELWRFRTSTDGSIVYSSPTVVDGVLYIGSHARYVFAIDARTGDERWRYSTGGAIGSSPTVADGVLYVGSDDGKLYALRLPAGG